MTIQACYEVKYYEYERGWGSNHWSSNYYSTREKAEEEIKLTNSRNNLPVAPDYYIKAEGPYLVELTDSITIKD